jgi:Zn-dependent peptidase ImmA (M78 family)
VVHGLAEKHQISFRFEQDLGFSPRGRKILGQFEFAPEQISIDRILQYDSPRFRWTLCHEIGHWVLHRFIDPRTISRDQPAFVDTRQQLQFTEPRSKFTAQWSELKWIEWQANQFASSLLLPEPILKRALFQVQSDLGVSESGYLV